jgi:hypothetical protein
MSGRDVKAPNVIGVENPDTFSKKKLNSNISFDMILRTSLRSGWRNIKKEESNMGKLVKVIVMAVVLAVCFSGLAFSQIKNKSEIVGLWKTDLILPKDGKEWVAPPSYSSFDFLQNGRFVFLSPVDKPVVRITGSWRIMPDGRLGLQEEVEENYIEKTRHIIEGSFPLWTLKDSRLFQPGIMLRKVK